MHPGAVRSVSFGKLRKPIYMKLSKFDKGLIKNTLYLSLHLYLVCSSDSWIIRLMNLLYVFNMFHSFRQLKISIVNNKYFSCFICNNNESNSFLT